MRAPVNILFSRKLREWEVQGNEIFWVMERSIDKTQLVLLFFLAASCLFLLFFFFFQRLSHFFCPAIVIKWILAEEGSCSHGGVVWSSITTGQG